MRYAIVEGKLTPASKVDKGTIAKAFGYSNLPVIACKGRQRSYWKFVGVNKTTYSISY